MASKRSFYARQNGRINTRIKNAIQRTRVSSHNISVEITMCFKGVYVLASDKQNHNRQLVTWDDLGAPSQSGFDPLEAAINSAWSVVRKKQWTYKRDRARRPVSDYDTDAPP